MNSAFSSVHFYVTLKDDFGDRCLENGGASLFSDIDDPYSDAKDRLTPGKVYPVLGVEDQGRHLTVIDDAGRPWSASTGLFKFAPEQN